jgi:flagellar basal-body rod protein FlgB
LARSLLDVSGHRCAEKCLRREGGGNGVCDMASDSLFGIHATALKLREQRMAILASNIANAATPNYKARDLDFGAALALAENGQSSQTAVAYRIPLQPSLDGNTVELATEQTAFAENALSYRSSLSFLQGRISTLSRALKGE